jgi:effector-binding domain-containing protein
MSEFSLVERAPQPTAVVRSTIAVAEIPTFLRHAYEAVMQGLGSQGIAPVGEPFAYYLGMPTATVELEAGFPIAAPCVAAGEAIPSELPGGTIATGTHVGPYEKMVDTYNQLMAWMAQQGLVPGEQMWEIYLTDPAQEPDASRWQTQIFWPVSGAALTASTKRPA